MTEPGAPPPALPPTLPPVTDLLMPSGVAAAIVAALAAGAGNVTNPDGTEALRRYWITGEGGTVKIRWNTPGDFTRCVRELREHLGARTEGYCALLHKRATGVYPGDRRNV